MSQPAKTNEVTEVLSPPSRDTGRRLLTHLKLIPEQKQQLVAVRCAYLRNLAVIIKRRQQASAALQVGVVLATC